MTDDSCDLEHLHRPVMSVGINKRADFPPDYVFMKKRSAVFILLCAVTLVVCFRGVAELSGEVFVVVEVQRG